MSDAAPSRWSTCPTCGGTAEVLFLRPRCATPGCRWYDEAIQDELILAARAEYRITYSADADAVHYP